MARFGLPVLADSGRFPSLAEARCTEKDVAEKFCISETRFILDPEGGLGRDLDQGSVQYGPRAAMPTKLDPYKETIKTRLDRYLEGISSVVQAAKAKARGYRSLRNLITMIYLLTGKLEFRTLPI